MVTKLYEQRFAPVNGLLSTLNSVTVLTSFQMDCHVARPRNRPGPTKGDRRRAAILAAAADLFRERGFRATSLDDIGAVAGVSGPAIYRYFSQQARAAGVLVEEAAITWRETVDEVLNEDTPPLVTLEHLIDTAVALQLKNGNLRGVFRQEFRFLTSDRSRLARIDRVTWPSGCTSL